MNKLHVTHAAPSCTSLIRPCEFCSSLSTASDQVGHVDFTVASYATIVEYFILTTPLHSLHNVLSSTVFCRDCRDRTLAYWARVFSLIDPPSYACSAVNMVAAIQLCPDTLINVLHADRAELLPLNCGHSACSLVVHVYRAA